MEFDLLFRGRCGCPISKLEGRGPKKGRRHKKCLEEQYYLEVEDIISISL
ncbi:hypothetical protein MANES_16G052070v8 [Manihot esculenta]|uniref:Uncharacterized protein n=1 Tax=Manihot esculenta TaxID=3983 RepID=A0ACB7G7A6_MANES|nr:hypothetical protein MANES_16G052070v8 [Manihot esculenta]